MARTATKAVKAPDISRADFQAHATPLRGDIAGSGLVFEPRQFSTGSYGWSYNGKLLVELGGRMVTVQANINLVVAHSKEG
jgi:hypothetical protein